MNNSIGIVLLTIFVVAVIGLSGPVLRENSLSKITANAVVAESLNEECPISLSSPCSYDCDYDLYYGCVCPS